MTACIAMALVGVLARQTAAVAAPSPVRPELFGLHINDPVGHYPSVPFGTVRLWDSGTTWRDVNPRPGVWDFSNLDTQVETLRASRKDIVLVLGVTPQWASKRPREAGNYGPGSAAEPANIATWREYVRRLAVRYDGKINKWELYNEPNAALFFSGTPQSMVGMAREAWIQLKTVNRANVVISPGIVTRTENSPKWLDTYLKAGGSRYANVVAVHFYVKARERPEATLRYLAIVRTIMAARGVKHLPLWNTESGYGRANPTDPLTHEVYVGTTSMAYVARTYVLMASSNVSRSYWYGWDQRGYTGLYLTTDGKTAGPAGRAYGVTYGWLVGSRVHSCAVVRTGALVGAYSCVVTKGRVQRRILWHADRTVTIRIPAGYRSLHRLDGSSVPVRAGVRFTVGPVPVLISR